MNTATMQHATPEYLSPGHNSDMNMNANYNHFIAELTALTRKYGVALQSVGGVILANETGEFSDVTYVADITSGDLYPRFSDN